MTLEEYAQRIEEIVVELDKLAKQDMAIIQAQPSEPTILTADDRLAWVKRDKRRHELLDELRTLCLRPVEYEEAGL